VVVQAGRGGIGKTRLLRALATELQAGGTRVLFARPGVELAAEAVDELPLEPVVVIVDDAHRPDVSLWALLAEASRRPDLTGVLGVRPAGRDAVLATAAGVGLEPGQMVVLSPLGSLGHDDVLVLAESAAGRAGEQTKRLADATEESPLITVIGGSLLARGQLGPATDEELRRSVLARFSAEQLGRVTPRVPQAQARALATLVAALQPLNAEDDELMAIVGKELDVPVSQVRRWLGELEAAGVLLARGRLRRLTPDVLADELLLEACVDAPGRSTGYAGAVGALRGLLGREPLEQPVRVGLAPTGPRHLAARCGLGQRRGTVHPRRRLGARAATRANRPSRVLRPRTRVADRPPRSV